MKEDGEERVIMGGIIKHNGNGFYGFKISFSSPIIANKYKDMFRTIILSDNHPITYQQGYYDSYNSDGELL